MSGQRPPRKRLTPLPPPPPLPDLPADAIAGARALDELLELHREASIGRLCLECLTEYPCRTRRLAEVVAGTATPREDTAP